MIVRINQIESALAEATAAWGAGELRGAIRYAWPENAFIYQVHILDRDEHGRQLETSYVQSQFRRLIPHVVAALDDGGERAVVRFDGSLVEGELLAAVRYLDACERFAVSPIQRLTNNGEPVVASIRLLPANGDLTKLCADPLLGLERSVRMRVIAVPDAMVNPLLDTAETDDERSARDFAGRDVCALDHGWIAIVVNLDIEIRSRGGKKPNHAEAARIAELKDRAGMSRRLRILYAAGPGDVVGTYRHWKSGVDDPSQVAITYSAQFYQLCKELDADGYVISVPPPAGARR